MTADQILSMNKAKTEISDSYAKRVFFSTIGLPENGIANVVLFGFNDDGREAKILSLREQGFRYFRNLQAWVCRIPAVGVKTVRVDFNDLIEKGWDGVFHFKDMARSELVKRYMNSQGPKVEKAGFVGQIGERIRLPLELTGSSTVRCESDFGDFTVLYFLDDDGNRLSWFQRNYSEDTVRLFMKRNKVKKVDVAGTVKKQTTRLGIHYTELSKCEITANCRLLSDFAKALRDTRNEEK